MTSERPQVSIAIVTYNRREKLRQCLDSVLNQEFQSKEVVVVDDGSTDGTEELVEGYKKEYSFLRYFRRKHCGTPTPHRNYCLEKATGEFIFFIDDDCVAHENWIEGHMQYFERPEVGAVGGPQIVSEPGFVDKYIYSIFIDNNTLYQEWADRKAGDAPVTSNAAYRRDVALECGGFDERIPTGEDVDLGLRIIAAGYTLINNPDNFVTHLKRTYLWGMVRTAFYRGSGGVARYLSESPRRRGFFSPHLEFSQLRSRLERFKQTTQKKISWHLKLRVHFLTLTHFYATLAGRIYYYYTLGPKFRKA